MNRARSLALIAAAGLPLRAGAQAAPSPVRMVAVIGGDFAIGFFANELGFFKQQNLDVQTTLVPGGGAATAALVGGSYDIAITNIGSTANAFVRGLPIVLLTGGGLYSSAGPSAFFVGPLTTTLRTAKDLAGKTIGVSSLRDLAQVAIMSWIDQNGGDSRASTYLEIPPLDIPPALARGRIDAGLVIDPRYTAAKDTLHVIATPYDAIAKQFMISGVIVARPWLEANAGVAQRVATALRAAAAWGNKNQQQSSELVAKYTKIPIELVARTPRAPLAVDSDARMLQPPIDALAKYAFIPRRFAATEMIAKGI